MLKKIVVLFQLQTSESFTVYVINVNVPRVRANADKCLQHHQGCPETPKSADVICEQPLRTSFHKMVLLTLFFSFVIGGDIMYTDDQKRKFDLFLVELQTKIREDFTLTEKAPTRVFYYTYVKSMKTIC